MTSIAAKRISSAIESTWAGVGSMAAAGRKFKFFKYSPSNLTTIGKHATLPEFNTLGKQARQAGEFPDTNILDADFTPKKIADLKNSSDLYATLPSDSDAFRVFVRESAGISSEVPITGDMIDKALGGFGLQVRNLFVKKLGGAGDPLPFLARQLDEIGGIETLTDVNINGVGVKLKKADLPAIRKTMDALIVEDALNNIAMIDGVQTGSGVSAVYKMLNTPQVEERSFEMFFKPVEVTGDTRSANVFYKLSKQLPDGKSSKYAGNWPGEIDAGEIFIDVNDMQRKTGAKFNVDTTGGASTMVYSNSPSDNLYTRALMDGALDGENPIALNPRQGADFLPFKNTDEAVDQLDAQNYFTRRAGTGQDVGTFRDAFVNDSILKSNSVKGMSYVESLELINVSKAENARIMNAIDTKFYKANILDNPNIPQSFKDKHKNFSSVIAEVRINPKAMADPNFQEVMSSFNAFVASDDAFGGQLKTMAQKADANDLTGVQKALSDMTAEAKTPGQEQRLLDLSDNVEAGDFVPDPRDSKKMVMRNMVDADGKKLKGTIGPDGQIIVIQQTDWINTLRINHPFKYGIMKGIGWLGGIMITGAIGMILPAIVAFLLLDMMNAERNALGGCWIINTDTGEQCKFDPLTCFAGAKTVNSDAMTQEVRSCDNALSKFSGQDEMTVNQYNECKITPQLIASDSHVEPGDLDNACDPSLCIPQVGSTMKIFENSDSTSAALKTIEILNNQYISNCIDDPTIGDNDEDEVVLYGSEPADAGNAIGYRFLVSTGEEIPDLTFSEMQPCGARLYKYGPVPPFTGEEGSLFDTAMAYMLGGGDGECDFEGKYCDFPAFNAPSEAFCSTICDCANMQCADGQMMVCYVPSLGNVFRSLVPNPFALLAGAGGLGSIFKWALYIFLGIGFLMVLGFISNLMKGTGF